jgi:outer membrane protein TolC
MVEAARASWRALLGAEVDAPLRPAPTDLPPWPNAIPDIETLQSLSLRDHPDLARLRAEHKVAEKVLRLEAARAIPDLDIGGVYEYEVVGSKLALPLGIEIPISDRNQPAIAAALGARAAVKERYAARLTELLADVERNHKLLETKLEKYRLLQLQLVDAREMRKAADETLQLSGALDMTRYLEILRTLRRVKLQELEGRTDVYEGWFKLEQATGAPLLRFANEPGKVQ